MPSPTTAPRTTRTMSNQVATLQQAHHVLRDRFGLDEFREGQQQVISSLLAGRSAVAVFPTGGGKSLCYQLPALMLPGLTLVVSPLIALMKDQCDALARRGILAARFDSTQTASELSQSMRDIRSGKIKLLYVAPERFFNERFRAAIADVSISLFAIDEAHCISQWGHNFRPDYLKLADVVKAMGIERVLALTATATAEVLTDIRSAFGIEPSDAVRTPFFRPNLQLQSSLTTASQRDQLLLDRLRQRPQGPTLVYVTLQRTAEEVAEYLAQQDLPARAYHAGMDSDQRSEIQQWFLTSKHAIVVATIAFGMGIDKPDIRYVYHYNLSKSLEAYAQEIGRAGRDGDDSICETLLVPEDRVVLDNFSFGDTPEPSGVTRLLEVVAGQAENFHISQFRLSSETDIRILVVRTLLTYLELDGWIEATSPRYDTYQINPLVSSQTILGHFKGERRQFVSGILSTATKGRKWHSIPLPIACQRLQSDRERIIRALDYLAERQWIELRVSDLVHGYRRLKPIENPAELSAHYYERLLQREASEVARLDQVLQMLAGGECHAWRLSAHFGEQLDHACGRCSACQQSAPTQIPQVSGRSIGRAALTTISELSRKHQGVLGTARQKARFLCGMTCPSLTRARLSREPAFGVCAEVPFAQVLAACKELG